MRSKIDFNYCVFDCDNFPIKRFVTREDAIFFISNKPDMKVKKIEHIDWDNYEPAFLQKGSKVRCKACDKVLSDYEATRKGNNSREFIDLCNYCYSTISKEILVDEREDLMTPDAFIDDDYID